MATQLNDGRLAHSFQTYMQFHRTLNQYDDQPISWQRFLSKACIGSYKAVDFLTSHTFALVTNLAGPDALDTVSSLEFESLLISHLPKSFPAPHPQAFAQHLFYGEILTAPLLMHNSSFHSYDTYENLWREQRTMPLVQAVHDAILLCASHWSPAEFLQRLNNVEQQAPNYNSLDTIACMLMLATAWPDGSQQLYAS